jgi:hypothetical protein
LVKFYNKKNGAQLFRFELRVMEVLDKWENHFNFHENNGGRSGPFSGNFSTRQEAVFNVVNQLLLGVKAKHIVKAVLEKDLKAEDWETVKDLDYTPKVLKGVFEGGAFDMIVSGEKKDDWREDSRYWDSRLEGRKYDFFKCYHGNVFDDDLAWVLVGFLGAEKVEVEGGEFVAGPYSNGYKKIIVGDFVWRIRLGSVVEKVCVFLFVLSHCLFVQAAPGGKKKKKSDAAALLAQVCALPLHVYIFSLTSQHPLFTPTSWK